MGYIDQITNGGTTLYTLGMQPINMVIIHGDHGGKIYWFDGFGGR